MHEVDRILFPEEMIAARVEELADRITRDYSGKEVMLISILKGAALFSADLFRRIALPVTIEFIRAASYGNATTSSGIIRMEQDITVDLHGRHVLLVDTIIDTGATMAFLIRHLSERNPTSIRTAVLLDKKSKRTTAVSVNYTGFEISDLFVAGYGMDCGERFRNLPYIVSLRQCSDNTG